MNKTICIGSRGVNHPTWFKGFYPDDLPSEWRLSYYSNEFRALLLLHDDIKSLSADDLAEWLEELDVDFTLLYAVEFDALAALTILPLALRQRLQAVVCDLSLQQLTLLLNQPPPLSVGAMFYLRCLDGVPSDVQLEQLTGRGWRLCWQLNQHGAGASAPVLFLDGNVSLREMRHQLESFLASEAVEADNFLVFLEGEPLPIESLHQGQILVGLLV